MERESGKSRDCHGVSAGRRTVRSLPRSNNQRFMPRRCRVEPSLLLIEERFHHPLSQFKCGCEVSFLPTGFIEVDQSFRQIGIVLQYSIEMSTSLTRGTEQRSFGRPMDA